MKKILFLLLLTVSSYGQTLQNPTYGNTTTNTLKIKSNVQDNSATKIPVQSADGTINWVNKADLVSQTTAGTFARVNFTGDVSVVNSVNYYATNTANKGSIASVAQTVSPDDNQKLYFAQDYISILQPSLVIYPAGTYSGQFAVQVANNSVNQKFYIEIYKTNNLGVPIASGVAGASVGSLGVKLITTLESGLVSLTGSVLTNITFTGTLTGQLTLDPNERVRYHIAAEKVGTAGGTISMQIFSGTNYNSYYDVPVPVTTDDVVNKVPGLGNNSTAALTYLNTNKANLLGGNTFTGDQNLSSVNGNGRIGLLPIANNIAGTYNQPFYQSDFGYSIFRPYGTNLAQRFYLIPNGTVSGATAKFEMFNTDYYANAVTYAGLNVFTENINNRINFGSNRGSGGGTRMGMLFYGDYIGSNSGAQNANSIQFYTNNDLALNEWAGAIGFGTATTDPFALSVANQFTFKNSAATATRVNIVGNGTTAGLYFGRDAIRTIALESVLTTSDLRLSLNSTNSGSALTAYGMVYAATGNMILQNGGTFTDTGERLKVVGTISATTYTGGAALTNAPTAPTATAGTNTTQIATTAFVQAATRPYKVYTALLSQTGTSAPTATILENNTGATITWSRTSTGVYVGTASSNIFTANKTGFLATPYIGAFTIGLQYGTVNSFTVDTRFASGNTFQDAILNLTMVEVRIYN